MYSLEWRSLEFVSEGPIDKKYGFVQVMVCHPSGDKPLPEPMLTYPQLDPKEQTLV